MATSFYRGTVSGTPVTLAAPALPEDATARFRAALAFAAWQPATCKGTGATDFALLLQAAATPPPVPHFAESNDGFLREIAPGLFFELNLAARQAVFTCLPPADPARNSQTLERIRSEILQLLGLCTPALALHASCVATDANRQAVWIFCGPSGAGKTTISTVLLKDLALIDQETVLLDLGGPSPRLLNTPAPVAQAPAIAGLYQLTQAPHCRVLPLSASIFIAKNMTRPFDLHLPALLEIRLDKLTRLTAALRPRELHFNLRPAEVLAALRPQPAH